MIEWVLNSSRGTYGYRRVHAAGARRGVETSPGGGAHPSCAPRAWRPHSHAERTRRHRPGRRARGSRPDLVRRDSRRQQAGRAGGWAISPISAPGRGSCTWRPFWTAARRKQSSTRLGRQHAAPTPLCEAIDMAVRRCPHMTGETVFHSDRGCQYTSEQLGDHLESYGTRPSVGRTGVCWAGAWAEVGGCDPQGTRGSIRWCIPQEARPSGILPPRSSWNTRSETTSSRPGVQDAGRGRPGAPSSKTSSLKDRFQSCPRHARQPRLSCSSICVQTSSSAIPYSP